MVLSSVMRFKLFFLVGGGAASITFGALLLCYSNYIIKTIVYKELQLTEGSKSHMIWRDTPVPQTMTFYYYNWTNPTMVRSEKPKLVQLGPFNFKVIEKKTNVIWNKNGTVTFRIQRTWYFDQESSNGTLEDEVTTINAVAMSAASTVRHKGIFLKKGLGTAMWATKQKHYVTKPVGDLLFFGSEDSLLDMAKRMPAFDGLNLPPYDKFAWFYGRNGSDLFEGTFEMHTGVNDIYSYGVLKHWNYDKDTPFYPSPCSAVKGSAGELFPPERRKTYIEMYSADLCRSIKLSYKNDEEIHGIKGYKFTGDEYTFDNGTLDPSNECFCDGECSPSGVLNVTTCRYGAPGFVSFPHFYLADPFYENHVEGIQGNPEADELYITLEPTTGIPLDVAARFQINIRLSEVNGISLFENMSTIYFPVIWFEQKATITEELASEIRLVLNLPFYAQCFAAFLLIFGILIFSTAIYFKMTSNNREECNDIKLKQATEEPLLTVDINKSQIVQQKSLLVTETTMSI